MPVERFYPNDEGATRLTPLLTIPRAWINAEIAPGVGAVLVEREGYGNAMGQTISQKAWLTYADKLVFLQLPENFAKPVASWNDVKAVL
jgi:hypothetical protein